MSNAKMPSVLAFERKLSPSNAVMFAANWESRGDSASHVPVALIDTAGRGVMGHRLSKKDEKDSEKLNQELVKPNIVRGDVAFLPSDKDTLVVHFTLKVMGGLKKASACNDADFAKKHAAFVDAYRDRFGFIELARRYAVNIAGGAALWRNRETGGDMEVIVKAGDERFEFKTGDVNLHTLNSTKTSDIEKLATLIADQLSSEGGVLVLDVESRLFMGKGQEVYPSQEMVTDKKTSGPDAYKSKFLFAVDGIAALHSQKVGNAIRRIDTWYPDYAAGMSAPIAVETYGAVTTEGHAYRKDKGSNFFALYDKVASGSVSDNEGDQHYMIAMIIRGGVFGESGKE